MSNSARFCVFGLCELTPPPAPPLKNGRGEFFFLMGCRPLTFLQSKKVSKKDLDLSDSLEYCYFEAKAEKSNIDISFALRTQYDNFCESKKFNDSTPLHNFTPPHSHIPQGDGKNEDSLGVAQSHLLFAMQKVRKKTFDFCDLQSDLLLTLISKSCDNLVDSHKSQSLGFKGATPPCSKFPSARMGLSTSPSLAEGARGWSKFQNPKDLCEAPKTRPLRGVKNRIQGRSSASADFLLEAEKRGTPPKSEKAAAFWRVGGAGRGVQPFLREKTSESSGEIDEKSVRDSHELSAKNMNQENKICDFKIDSPKSQNNKKSKLMAQNV